MTRATLGGTSRVQLWQRILLVVLVLIVFTGAAVRLTASGLGCEDWPGCSQDSFVPEADFHGLIEFGNRLLSGFVLIASLVVTGLIIRDRKPLERDLNYSKLANLNIAIVFGVITQAIVGLLTVRSVLDPRIVGIHFLLSIVLIDLGVRALHELRVSNSAGVIIAPRPKFINVVKTLLAVAIVLGVVVTGSGPNSGDTRATRLGFDLTEVTRIHSVSVWLLIGFTLVAIYLNRSNIQAQKQLFGFSALLVSQGAIGYTQFAIGVPPALVFAHVALATLIWTYVSQISMRNTSADRTLIDLRSTATTNDSVAKITGIRG